MFRKGIFNSDNKINDSTNISRLISSPPQADSTHIEDANRPSSSWNGKLTPKRRAVSPLQNAKGITKISNSSPILSRKIDPQVFTDVQSRGLTSRIVKYHEMNKQNERPLLKSNYTKPGEFPIVNLNSKKELPYVAKRNLSSNNPPVRIAPPDKNVTNLNYRSQMLRNSGILIKNDNEPLVPTSSHDANHRTRSVLDELTEISRKRINNEELKIDSIKKTCIETNLPTDQSDGGGSVGLGGLGLMGNKKRQRDTTSPTSISPTKMDNLHLNKKNCLVIKKPSTTKNNDILSSLSSSMIFQNPKLSRNNQVTVNHPNSYNTNNVFIQSIERQYHNRVPTTFDAHPNHVNHLNLIQASSSPVIQTTYSVATTLSTTSTKLVSTKSEPNKPAATTQKLLLFNRPEAPPQQQAIRMAQAPEDSTINFVKPKQIIDNNLIIESNKIDESNLLKRKSNLTGIERSKLAMMLESLKSDDEEDEELNKDEFDSNSIVKSVESALSKTTTTTISSIVSGIGSQSSFTLPSTANWTNAATSKPNAFTIPPATSGGFDKSTALTTTVSTVSASPVMTSKIETSTTVVGAQNTAVNSILKSIVTPNVSTSESKSETNTIVTTASPRLGGFSFPISSVSSLPEPVSTSTTVNSGANINNFNVTPTTVSSALTAAPSFSFGSKPKTISTLPSVSPSPAVSVAAPANQPQSNPSFSFFNKSNGNTTSSASPIKLTTPQLNFGPSTPQQLNFSTAPTSLPSSTMINFNSTQNNFTSPQANSTNTSFTSPSQNATPNANLNLTFGGVVIPTTTSPNATSAAVPMTTTASTFSFGTNNSNVGGNKNFSDSTTTPSMFGFNSAPPEYKPKVQAITTTTESPFSFAPNTTAPAPSVSVVKPFSFSGSNNTQSGGQQIPTENPMFNNTQQPKNMFGGTFSATAPATTTASQFSFGGSGGGANPTQTTQQSSIFGNNSQASLDATVTKNNSETTLFNFKTTTAGNINNNTNQVVPNVENSSNLFKLGGAIPSNPGTFGTHTHASTNNVFGGSGMQQKNDIFGGGMNNNTANNNNLAKPVDRGGSNVFNFTSPTTTPQANPNPSSTFSFAGANKNQLAPPSNTNIFGSSSVVEQSKPFSFGGVGGGSGNSLNKVQSPPSFGQSSEPAKSFSFGQNTISNNNIMTNKPPAFGSNVFGGGFTNTEPSKLEPTKSAFAFGTPNLSQQQQPSSGSGGMFSFSNNTNTGQSNNNQLNINSTGQGSNVFGTAQQAGPQNPFSIGPGGTNAAGARRPVRQAVRRLNK